MTIKQKITITSRVLQNLKKWLGAKMNVKNEGLQNQTLSFKDSEFVLFLIDRLKKFKFKLSPVNILTLILNKPVFFFFFSFAHFLYKSFGIFGI